MASHAWLRCKLRAGIGWGVLLFREIQGVALAALVGSGVVVLLGIVFLALLAHT